MLELISCKPDVILGVVGECCTGSTWENGHSRCCLYGTHGGYLLNNRITFLLLQIKPLSCWRKQKGCFTGLFLHPRCTRTSCPTLCTGESMRSSHQQRSSWGCAACSADPAGVTAGVQSTSTQLSESNQALHYMISLLLYCKIHEQLNSEELNCDIYFS